MSAPQITPFGTTTQGQDVARITLHGHGLSVAIITKGATLQSVRLAGVDHDLTIGSDRLADYEGIMRHHGSLVAPVVNRFKGATAPIGGKIVAFEANQGGKHTLHCGAAGTHCLVLHRVRSPCVSARLRPVLCRSGEGSGLVPVR